MQFPRLGVLQHENDAVFDYIPTAFYPPLLSSTSLLTPTAQLMQASSLY
jgi:hypothetical protein